jgi:hypothetical protein
MSPILSEIVGKETIHDIEFTIEKNVHNGRLMAHCWIKDEVSGLVYAAVEVGNDWADLKEKVNLMVDEIAKFASEESGKESRLIGLGSDYSQPPGGRR